MVIISHLTKFVLTTATLLYQSTTLNSIMFIYDGAWGWGRGRLFAYEKSLFLLVHTRNILNFDVNKHWFLIESVRKLRVRPLR